METPSAGITRTCPSRSSKTPAEAKDGLMETFGFTAVQAQAILDMRLQRLTALERDKIIEEYRGEPEIWEWIERIRQVGTRMVEDES